MFLFTIGILLLNNNDDNNNNTAIISANIKNKFLHPN